MTSRNGSFINLLLHLKMRATDFFLVKPLQRAAENPAKAQQRLLMRILDANKNTAFGKAHGFSFIKTYDDFRKKIPITEYEYIRPYIERQIAGEKNMLSATPPVMYAQTSGTTGKVKYVPVLKETIKACKRAQDIFSAFLYTAMPGIFSGKIGLITSPAVEGHMPDGAPYGSMSGILYKSMPALVQSKYVLPPEVFEITDYEARYFLIAALLARESDISSLACANPSTFIRVGEVMREKSEALIDFIATGKTEDTSLTRFMQPDPARAKELRALAQKGSMKFHDLWPGLKALVTWTYGNSALLLPKIRTQLGPATRIIEMGYMASEFRGTITCDANTNFGLPTFQDHFYEFVEKSVWDNSGRETLRLSELEAGKQYYIVVTALHGLYRYFINDIIEVKGFYEKTPVIAFVQKGKGVTSLTGEKLYEGQVIEGMQQVALAMNIQPDFFILLADQESFGYFLYLETQGDIDLEDVTRTFHDALCALNIEYAAKSGSGRIRSVQTKRLRPGTFEQYRLHAIQAGQREGQLKFMKLQYRKDVSFPFEVHVQS